MDGSAVAIQAFPDLNSPRIGMLVTTEQQQPMQAQSRGHAEVKRQPAAHECGGRLAQD